MKTFGSVPPSEIRVLSWSIDFGSPAVSFQGSILMVGCKLRGTREHILRIANTSACRTFPNVLPETSTAIDIFESRNEVDKTDGTCEASDELEVMESAGVGTWALDSRLW